MMLFRRKYENPINGKKYRLQIKHDLQTVEEMVGICKIKGSGFYLVQENGVKVFFDFSFFPDSYFNLNKSPNTIVEYKFKLIENDSEKQNSRKQNSNDSKKSKHRLFS